METDGTIDPSFFTVYGIEQTVSGFVGANRLGGSSGSDIHYQQDDGDNSDDSDGDYTIEVGLVELDLGEALTKTIEYGVDKMLEGIAALIDTFNQYILGVPAPGDPTEVSTWMSPGHPWPAVYGVYGIMSALAIALLTPSFMVATDTVDPQRRRARLAELGKAAFFILLGVPVVAFCLHFGNELSQVIAPSGYEFVSSSSGIGDLGLGLIFGAILLWAKGTVVGLGILMSIIIYMSVYIMVAFWPFFWALRVQPQADLQSVGIVGISVLPLLIALRFSQSGILRLIHQLPYGSLGGTAFKLLAITSGLVIALLALPYLFLTKLIPRSIILTGERMINDNSGGGGAGLTTGRGGGGGQSSGGGGGGSPPPDAPAGRTRKSLGQPGVTSESPDNNSSFKNNDKRNITGIPGNSPKGGSSTQGYSRDSTQTSSNDTNGDDTEDTDDDQIGATSENPNR